MHWNLQQNLDYWMSATHEWDHSISIPSHSPTALLANEQLKGGFNKRSETHKQKHVNSIAERHNCSVMAFHG